MAYNFHWSRGDILGMTGYERKTWLSQINRIRFEEKQAREEYMVENISRLIAMRKQEQE